VPRMWAAHRVQRLLRIRPGEGRTVAQLLAMMLVLFAGMTLGGAAVESLLFARSGPENLPPLYMALGPLTLVVMAAMGGLLARPDPRSVLVWTYPGVAAVLVGAWGLVEVAGDWVYPVLWLVMMVLWTVGVFTAWGLAGLVHDTRQAKRLFPIYGAGLIVGGALGGAATAPLAAWISAERLLLVWAGTLLVAWWMAARVARGARRPGRRTSGHRPWRELAEGLRTVRASRLLRSMAVALALFSLLYFALSFVFARSVTARFPDPDRLAGFLGGFAAAINLVALGVSLLVANRLFARFGVVPMVLFLPLIYMAGFGTLTAVGTFAVIVAFRAVQMVWVNGVWATGWQALFNVVPSDRRGQVRVFMDAVPLQAGIVVSGALLLLADRLSASLRQVAVVGLVAAGIAVAAMWIGRRAYVSALVQSLRTGNPEVFVAEEEPFAGVARDRAAMQTLVAGARSDDPVVRALSVEMLAEVDPGAARTAIARTIRDPDPEVRRAALAAIPRVPFPEVVEGVLAGIEDGDPALRVLAAEALAACGAVGADVTEPLGGLLIDPSPAVRAAAAAGLGDLDTLLAMAGDPRPEVRAGGVRALGREALDGERRRQALVAALADPDAGVREAAAAALPRLGPEALEALVGSLEDPAAEAAALQALGALGPPDLPALRAYAERQVSLAASDGRAWRALEEAEDEAIRLLADTFRHRCFERGMRALRAAAAGDAAREVVLENLLSPDAEQRANALEVLDAATDRSVTRPLLEAWDDAVTPTDRVNAVRSGLVDADPWVRACAVLAAARSGLDSPLARVGSEDPDLLVRETARLAAMETLTTVPLLERVVFLRRVPLFAALAPVDVKHVAEVATEHVHVDGTTICGQGEAGEELYVVVSGDIRVERDGAEVARRGPGEYVGEMAVITGGARMASLIADGEVRILVVDRRRFERILRERPDASLALMRTLCERVVESHEASSTG